jgi:hypothetical protein
VLAGRDIQVQAILPAPSPDDGAARLVVTRTTAGKPFFDLYLIVDPGGGRPVTEQLIVERWFWSGCALGYCRMPSDSRGRLLIQSVPANPNDLDYGLVRLDPVTGERSELGPASYFYLSASRRRLVVVSHGNSTKVRLIEEDDQTLQIDVVAGSVYFVGEDLYYLDDSNDLRRVIADGTSELVRAGIRSFFLLETSNGPLIVLTTLDGEPPFFNQFVLDPLTGQVSQPISDSGATLSPDGAWILKSIPVDFTTGLVPTQFVLIERSTGLEEAFELPQTMYGYFQYWRPGSNEIWFFGTGTLSIKRPGLPVVTVPGPPSYFAYNRYPEAFTMPLSPFTVDGRHWFSSKSGSVDGRYDIFAQRSDDPAGPGVRITPEGTNSYSYWQFPDGRLLTEAFYTVYERSDLLVVDPASGDSRLLARNGRVVTIGAERVLALLRPVDGVSELTSIVLDTGVSTLLAENVSSAAFGPSVVGGDPLPAGSRIAFTINHRFSSPYDGVWVTTLP